MAEVDLHRLDLQLLLALDALLEARSVTLAAERLHSSQPAVSRALARLRTELDDPLLVRSGNAMAPTPRGEQLAGPLREALAGLRRALSPTAPFSPATSRRRFRLATADYAVATVVPALLGALGREAPGIDLAVVPLEASVEATLEHSDVVLVPRRGVAAGVVWTRLLKEDFVCLGQRGTLGRGATVSLELLCDRPHVFIAPSGQVEGVLDERLRARGLARRVALSVPTFLAAPPVVAGSRLLCVLPRRIALACTDARLEWRELPLELPAFTLECAWHERVRQDPEHAWFRRLLKQVAATPDGPRSTT
jgi:DNA-binding transcriptional LysR family regulator